MGVKVGPQVFQRMVAHILNGCSRSGPNIDDVLMGTDKPPSPPKSGKGELLDIHAYEEAMPSEPEQLHKCKQYHLEAVRECFQRPPDAGLTVKPSKYFLYLRQVKNVGHILREGKRLPDLLHTKSHLPPAPHHRYSTTTTHCINAGTGPCTRST